MQDFRASGQKHVAYDMLSDDKKDAVYGLMNGLLGTALLARDPGQGTLVPEIAKHYRRDCISNVQIYAQSLPEGYVPKPEDKMVMITHDFAKKSAFRKEDYGCMMYVTNSGGASVSFTKKMGTRNMHGDKNSRQSFIDFSMDMSDELWLQFKELRDELLRD
jgi:hypothetical protein